MTKYDAIIIGGGPSGHSAAVRATQLGGKVALVERDFIGGICTNWGCTPSKAMIESAKIAKTVAESGIYGVDVNDFQINFQKVAERRNQVVLNTRAHITDLLKHHKIDIYQGEATIAGEGKVRVQGGKLDPDGMTMHYDGEEQILETKNIVVATGSEPLMPPFVKKDDPMVVSSNRLIGINELPETLTIIGGGVIGMEFATIFSNLGSKVTVIEFLPRVLASMDEDISTEITRIMEEKGVELLTNHKVLSVGDGKVVMENMNNNETIERTCSRVLVAIGRKAVLQEGISNAGMEVTKRGITVDDYQRTTLPGVWAIGDATGRSILAHVGIQQGIICAENMMAASEKDYRKMDYDVVPAVIYSIPEIVGVGSVPQDLSDVKVVKVPFSTNLRAGIEYYTDGFIKLWIRDEKLIAAQAIGHQVSEIFQEAANMVALGTNIKDVAEIIHAHPTYAEIIRSALEFSMDKAVDFYI